jgi:hypothetical protein
VECSAGAGVKARTWMMWRIKSRFPVVLTTGQYDSWQDDDCDCDFSTCLHPHSFLVMAGRKQRK